MHVVLVLAVFSAVPVCLLLEYTELYKNTFAMRSDRQLQASSPAGLRFHCLVSTFCRVTLKF